MLRGELSRISETVNQEDSENQEGDTETNLDDVQGHALEAVAQVSPQPSALSPQHVHTPEFDPVSSQQPPKEKTQLY